MRVRVSLAVLLLVACTAFAQAGAAGGAKPASDLEATITNQFGPDFKIVARSPISQVGGAMPAERRRGLWTPILTGDLDGDGIQDAVIVARNKNALIGAEAYGYQVIDPFHERYGWGNANITGEFNTQDPLHNVHLLVIHGAGEQAWKAEKPKAKYVLINIPFEQMSLSRAMLKKKPVDAIRVEESDTISSLVFWDGKKYRYSPGAAMP